MFRFSTILALSVVAALPVTSPAQGQSALQAPPKSAALPAPYPALPHPTLDRIRSSQALVCGVVKEEEDYSRAEDHGNRAAFDVDLCKAVAVAVLGPAAHLVIKSFPDEPFAIRALRSGTIDLVATAGISVANATQDVAFSPPVLLDGQGMLFPRNPAIHSAADLAGKRVCFLTGSAAEDGLHSYAEAHGISYIWYPFSEAGEMEAAFFTGNCDAVTSDLTQLANIRGIEEKRSKDFTILPETFRDDPLGVATWAGDPLFSTTVYWTVEALLNAEQLDITQENVKALAGSQRPEIQQLLGQGLGVADRLGARPHWGAEVIAAVGNYGEVFDRDLGAHSTLHLERGANRLIKQGGALYPVPLHDR